MEQELHEDLDRDGRCSLDDAKSDTEAILLPVPSSGAVKQQHDDVVAAVSPTEVEEEGEQTKRRGTGRATRRRRKRRNEIQRQAEQALLGLTSPGAPNPPDNNNPSQGPLQLPPSIVTTTTIQHLPADRSHTWPAVLERRSPSWQPDVDGVALIGQLGFLPGNALRVPCYEDQVPCLCKAPHSTKNGSTESAVYDSRMEGDGGGGGAPVTLELYPLALRNESAATERPSGGAKAGRRRRQRRQHAVEATTHPADRATNLITGVGGEATAVEADDAPTSDTAVPVGSVSASSPPDCSPAAVVLEPFPTLYWLTHPVLKTLVSQLEVEGWGRRLEERLASDFAALERMRLAHAAYGSYRTNLLTESDVTLLVERRWMAAVGPDRGIAGMRYGNDASAGCGGGVKCLHAHAAHYLSRSNSNGGLDNVVGQWVMELVEERVLRGLAAATNNSTIDGLTDGTPAIDATTPPPVCDSVVMH